MDGVEPGRQDLAHANQPITGGSLMNMIVRLAFVAGLGLALSGCAVAEVGGAVIGAGATVAGAAVDVTTTVVGTAASTISGSSDSDKKDDKKPD
jgi:hypothetical protein